MTARSSPTPPGTVGAVDALAVGWDAARVLAGAWLLWRLPRPADASGDRPPVAVVVPARDEARRIGPLLAALPGQLRPGDEAVVVDDGSTDATAALAAAAGVRVVPAPPLPDGWTGKSSACWTGAQATGAPLLVFVDADVEPAAGAVDAVVGEALERRGLVSVQPFHRVPSAVERLSAFFNLVAMMGTDAFTPLGRRLVARGAFGPVLATSRSDYLAAGGHRAVAGDVLDDAALAARYRRLGLPVTCLAGRDLVRFRMYPEGVRSLVEGWTKNFATGASRTRLATLLLVVAWLSVCIEAAWALATGPTTATAALYLAVAAELAWMLRRIGSFGLVTALLFPAPLAFFLAVFLRSVVLTAVRRRVRWRGRDVAVGQPGGRKTARRK